ncbi:BTAD domain-containing putative transcriptional regulator [Actinokineospora spheciospongiae]|uniref:BTAD domain-containing putative transcriptional regulator n=1 Tax=Actinokineospora spheciospongiae TaxID=909613 RepID=UPI000D712CC0|nr:BTAD domain-containing putative transcriptional regulator [Actinokineospora spheciospongiae]
MRFQVLGPLRVDDGGVAVGLGGTKQRVLLAHLLLNAGRVVRAAALVDALWGDEPPTSAGANLQTYVWRLRREVAPEALVRSGDGYALRVPEESVDAFLFRRECARARTERDPVVALELFEGAEALWRGEPLADLPAVPAWEAELSALCEARLAATEDRLALELRLGHHGRVAEELAPLLDEHPYRERLWQHHLDALAASGRRADALAAYRSARERFVNELGVEPGPGLRAAQARILHGSNHPAPGSHPTGGGHPAPGGYVDPGDHAGPVGHPAPGGYVDPGDHAGPVGHPAPGGYVDPGDHAGPVGHPAPGGYVDPGDHAGPVGHPAPGGYVDPGDHAGPVGHPAPGGHLDPAGHADPGDHSARGVHADPGGYPARGGHVDLGSHADPGGHPACGGHRARGDHHARGGRTACGDHGGPGGQHVPIRQLPPDLPDFTGREEAAAELLRSLAPRPGQYAAPVAVVSGPPGTGKSALAVHVAHRLREEYPEQFYADLGATGGRAPEAVLTDFLHALGVFGAGLPEGVAARAALLRSRLVGRRVLVLLDGATGAAQVRPLLPADGGCAVLVTARSRLPELVGAHSVGLTEFARAESVRLLAGIAGADRVRAEPGPAADVAEFCGHLPLAIRIAGTRLAGRRGWTVGVLRDRLADESRRLGELRVGDLAVRTGFELSVRQLPEAGVRAFGRLALLPGREFPAWAVDALLGSPAPDVLDGLLDAHLVAAAGPGLDGQPRYRLPDLLHCYAREVVDAEAAGERAAAFARSISALSSLAKRAARGLPASFGAVLGEAVGWTLDPADEATAVAKPLEWFGTHRHVLVRAVESAAAAGEAELAWQLAAASVPFHDLRGHYDDWHTAHQHALNAVREAENPRGEAVLLRGLGQVHLYRDEYSAAARSLTRSAELFATLEDHRGEASAVAGLGTLARVGNRPDQALPHYRRALRGFRAVNDLGGVAQTLGSLGSAYRALGVLDAAAVRLAAALDAARHLGDAHREAKVRTELAALHRDNHDFPAAEGELLTALSTLEELRDERCTAYAVLGLGRTLLGAGEPARARGLGERAVRVFRETGNRRGEAEALVLLARCRRPPRTLPGRAYGRAV